MSYCIKKRFEVFLILFIIRPDEKLKNIIDILLPGGIEYEETTAYSHTLANNIESPLDEYEGRISVFVDYFNIA